MLCTSKSGFKRRSNVIGRTSNSKMKIFVLQNDERKIFMIETSKSGFARQNTVF